MKKTVAELFAGVGGFRCGLNDVKLCDGKAVESGEWKFVWANQWEPATKTQEAFECYVRRFGGEEASNVDIFKVAPEEIPEHSLLVGGFPCQDYSVAQTLSTSRGIEGKKGVLWWAIYDILKAKRPPFVLLENVDRLLLSPAKQRGRDFGIILRSFADNGYALEWRVINAGEYGHPQKRRRTYIFAYHQSTDYYKKMQKLSLEEIVVREGVFAREFPFEKIEVTAAGKVTGKDYKRLVDVSNKFGAKFLNAGAMRDGEFYTAKVLAPAMKAFALRDLLETGEVAEKFFLDEAKLEKFAYLKGSKKIPRVKPNGEKYFYAEGAMPFPENLDAPARTMLTSEGSMGRSTHVVRDVKTGKIRLLTPLECERINQFPDGWTEGMPDKKRNFMMGNALVVGVIKKIGRQIEGIIEMEGK